jgi:hypothetical protein
MFQKRPTTEVKETHNTTLTTTNEFSYHIAQSDGQIFEVQAYLVQQKLESDDAEAEDDFGKQVENDVAHIYGFVRNDFKFFQQPKNGIADPDQEVGGQEVLDGLPQLLVTEAFFGRKGLALLLSLFAFPFLRGDSVFLAKVLHESNLGQHDNSVPDDGKQRAAKHEPQVPAYMCMCVVACIRSTCIHVCVSLCVCVSVCPCAEYEHVTPSIKQN